jgi:hypothetical protein
MKKDHRSLEKMNELEARQALQNMDSEEAYNTVKKMGIKLDPTAIKKGILDILLDESKKDGFKPEEASFFVHLIFEESKFNLLGKKKIKAKVRLTKFYGTYVEKDGQKVPKTVKFDPLKIRQLTMLDMANTISNMFQQILELLALDLGISSELLHIRFRAKQIGDKFDLEAVVTEGKNKVLEPLDFEEIFSQFN